MSIEKDSVKTKQTTWNQNVQHCKDLARIKVESQSMTSMIVEVYPVYHKSIMNSLTLFPSPLMSVKEKSSFVLQNMYAFTD